MLNYTARGVVQHQQSTRLVLWRCTRLVLWRHLAPDWSTFSWALATVSASCAFMECAPVN